MEIVVFTQLSCIKNKINSYMFRPLRDHHQGVCIEYSC